MSNILNLDKILLLFCGEDIFTDLNNDNYNQTVDVRSSEEFNSTTLLQHNVPVINIAQHQLLHKHLYLAGIIVFYGLFKNRQFIKRILIGCSQGRLRSPAVWLYARFLGIDAKILQYGIKHYVE